MEKSGKERAISTFRFKQFEVRNQRSAMKVNTDGVLLGAWCDVADCKRVWDVGTGTGVIALMIAQRQPAAEITGIDIDEASADEARDNFHASPWPNRLTAVCGDINAVAATLADADLIVCNPPFFDPAKQNLQSPEQRKSAARHEGTLGIESLINIAAEHLTPQGRLCLIAPSDREEDILFAASMAGMSIERLTRVHTHASRAPKRILVSISRKLSSTSIDNLYLRNENNNFTTEYQALVNEFYL